MWGNIVLASEFVALIGSHVLFLIGLWAVFADKWDKSTACFTAAIFIQVVLM